MQTMKNMKMFVKHRLTNKTKIKKDNEDKIKNTTKVG